MSDKLKTGMGPSKAVMFTALIIFLCMFALLGFLRNAFRISSELNLKPSPTKISINENGVNERRHSHYSLFFNPLTKNVDKREDRQILSKSESDLK